MFKIGDMVCSRKTGLPMTAKIISMVDAKFFLISNKAIDMENWSKLYPDWKDKIVIGVRFGIPQRNVSKEEFKEKNPTIPDELFEEAYHSIQPVSYAYYPEDDLEIFSAEPIDV